jgi:hypothetical protein
MNDLHSIYSGDRRKRVVFYANADGTFGFREECYSHEPLEECWLPRLWPDSRADSLDTAIAEATSRVAWLAKEQA